MTTVYEDMRGHWAESYVELANVLGIVKGISPSAYGPDNLIKFEEAYTMILRFWDIPTNLWPEPGLPIIIKRPWN